MVQQFYLENWFWRHFRPNGREKKAADDLGQIDLSDTF